MNCSLSSVTLRTALSFFELWYARAVRCRLKPMIAAAQDA